jgi:hypothetical protein
MPALHPASAGAAAVVAPPASVASGQANCPAGPAQTCYPAAVRPPAWWRVRDEALLWLAALFVLAVALWCLRIAAGLLLGL